MAGEPILIVDDTPVNLKLTRILLVNEGYKVMTAASAEEALEVLRGYHPELVLADIQLPGMDGLELTRRIKANEATSDITVVALTAFAMKGDEQKAIDAGCDGYITKPIDTRSLGARIREHLNRRVESRGLAPSAEKGEPEKQELGIPAAEMQALRRRFLSEGQERARQILLEMDGHFNANDAAKAVHNWIGTGGLLGYTAISRLAREVEAVLLERPLENDELRQSLTNLTLAFSSPREARDAPLSETIVQALSGKRVALVGLPASEAQRMCVALERTQSIPVFFEPAEAPESPSVLECDLIVFYVPPGAPPSPWLAPRPAAASQPMVFVGSREDLLHLDPSVQALAVEHLMESWQPEEALVRLSLACSRDRPAAPRIGRSGIPTGRVHVAIAEDDPAVLSLVQNTLQNFGMDCHLATDGPSALETIRRHRPHAAILDVNMPEMNGYEVLTAVRAEEIPVRILLLTARQQESDVLRAFALGADDYVIKPFSPMELVARLKRLLWQ